MDLLLLSPEVAEQIFNECDIRKKGALTVHDFRSLSELTELQFTDADTAFIFEQLDVNKDGLVTKEEFVNGFARALNLGEMSGFSGIKRRASLAVTTKNLSLPASPINLTIDENESSKLGNKRQTKIIYDFETDSTKLDVLPCQEEVLALYERLQSISIPELLTQFEKVIGGVCKELIDQRDQNERLQTMFKKEKKRHNQQIDEVETQLTAALTEAKEKARRDEREKLEREKELICQQFETELSELKSTIASLQKSVLDDDNAKYNKSEEARQKVQELTKDNLRLRHNLAEKQTELVLIQAAMARLRQNFDDKLSDWTNEREQLVQFNQNGNHQIQLLYEANKQLHDTNDNLRSALESRQKNHLNIRTPSPIGSNGRISPGSSMRQMSQLSQMSGGGGVWSQQQSYDSSANDPQSARSNHLRVRRQEAWLRGPEDSMDLTDEDIDSGMITRGSNTTDSAAEDGSQCRIIYGQAWEGGQSDRDESASQLMSTTNTSVTMLPNDLSLDYSLVRTDSLSSSGTGTRSSTHTFEVRSNPAALYQSIEPTGPAERTFRIVMVGDASVGKTSLITRLVKGAFQDHIPATIGIEYYGKCLRVDGRNVALQLWDTAGQEKFRSLCKTYFRRADGAILAYDTTCEQSFLNVRYWLEAVQESVTRKIPILLCANKVDLRIAATAQGIRCVSREDGENLAKIYNILYVETSAKDGTNVRESAVQLTRELLAAEDFEVRSTCVVLEQKKQTKGTCSSCKS